MHLKVTENRFRQGKALNLPLQLIEESRKRLAHFRAIPFKRGNDFIY